MEFEWDERIRRTNIDKHGIDFMDAKEIWHGDILEIPSPQTHHGERRTIALGSMRGRIVAVVYTWRRRKVRIISARKAREHEAKDYQGAFGRGA